MPVGGNMKKVKHRSKTQKMLKYIGTPSKILKKKIKNKKSKKIKKNRKYLNQ